jgi:hypothetical protein
MAISFTGATKTITLDTASSFAGQDIYDAAVDWAVIEGNMQYLLPMTGTGKAPFGGGSYSDIIFTLVNGWKLLTSGYSSTDIVRITGTFVSSTGDSADMINSSSTGIIIFDRSSFGTITTVSTGSGLSSEEHDKLYAVPVDVRTEMDNNSTKLKQIKNGVNALQ